MLQKLKRFIYQPGRPKQLRLYVVVMVVAAVGVWLLVASHALSPYAANEAESGTASSGATSVADSGASGGNYIKFGGAQPANFTTLQGFNQGGGDKCFNGVYYAIHNGLMPSRSIGPDAFGENGLSTDWNIGDFVTGTYDSNGCVTSGNIPITADKYFINSRAGRQIILSVPMINYSSTTQVADMQTGASGGFNSHWASLGQTLQSDGLGSIIIRPGWECGGNWYPWSAFRAGEANYAAYFRQIVTAMHSTAPKLQFAWNCQVYIGGSTNGMDEAANGGSDGQTADAAYPGDQYVDYIDIDPYNTMAFNTMLNTTNRSMSWWVNFATQHNKYLGFTEWNNSCPGGKGTITDGGTYITNMSNFIHNKANRVAYDLLFLNLVDGCNYTMGTNAKPAYTTTFGDVSKSPQGVLPPQSSGGGSGTTTPVSLPFRMAVGQSSGYTDGTGTAWVADQYVTGGSTDNEGAAHTIAGTANQQLYQSERWGTFSYHIPVSNGTHTLKLHFAEIYDGCQTTGCRVFNVNAEGQAILTNFDIVQDVGAAYNADDKTFTVNVTGGSLDLDFTPIGAFAAKLSGIELL